VGVLEAIRRMDVSDGAEAVVVCSSHGRFTGLYLDGVASLRGFGLSGPRFDVAIDAGLTGDLARSWNAGTRDDPLDHGIVVPLALVGARSSVAAATIAEDTDVTEAIERGRSLGRALAALPQRVTFVASAHTGAALTTRAPLGLREGSLDVEGSLLAHLTGGEGDGDAILEDLGRIGGSCGAGPLAAFAELFAGKAVVLAHEAPFGVGYLVATAAP
jgi:hypothetical protein